MSGAAKAGRRSPPLRLVTAAPRADVVEHARLLLQTALAGEITGLAFVATVRGREFISNLSGECLINPTLTRGMLALLGDQVAGVQHEMRGED